MLRWQKQYVLPPAASLIFPIHFIAALLCQTGLFIYKNVCAHFSWLDCIRYRKNLAWDVYSLLFILMRFISSVKCCGTERVCQRDKAEQEMSHTLHSAKQAAPDIGMQFVNVHLCVREKNRESKKWGVSFISVEARTFQLMSVCASERVLCKYVSVRLVPCHSGFSIIDGSTIMIHGQQAILDIRTPK